MVDLSNTGCHAFRAPAKAGMESFDSAKWWKALSEYMPRILTELQDLEECLDRTSRILQDTETRIQIQKPKESKPIRFAKPREPLADKFSRARNPMSLGATRFKWHLREKCSLYMLAPESQSQPRISLRIHIALPNVETQPQNNGILFYNS